MYTTLVITGMDLLTLRVSLIKDSHFYFQSCIQNQVITEWRSIHKNKQTNKTNKQTNKQKIPE